MFNDEFIGSPDIKRILLDKININVHTVIPNNLIENCTIRQYADHVGDNLIYNLECYLLTKTHTDKKVDKVINVPADWWQHFKERFFPKLLLESFPVQYRRIEVIQNITTTNICPHMDSPSDGDCVEFLMYKR